MKKSIIVSLLFAIVICFTGCAVHPSNPTVSTQPVSGPTKFFVAEVSDYTDSSIIAHDGDISLTTERFTKKSPSSKAVTIKGTKISGKYQYSTQGYLYNSQYDWYMWSKESQMVEYRIDSSGTIVYFSEVDTDYAASKEFEPILSEDECLDVATNYLGGFVDDANAYTLVNTRYLTIPEYNAIYYFDFVRYVNGIETSDNAYIGVTVYGDVISHLFGTVGEMEQSPTLSEEDHQTINSNIDNKIMNIYAALDEKYSYSYEVTNTTLVKLSDGKYALEYYVSVTFSTADDTDCDLAELVKLLVYLD